VDRAIVYDGEQLNASDVAWTNIFAMTGVGKLAKAVIGAGPSLNDLTCVPTSPASLSVLLNPGEIYSLENVDNSDFGPIPTNTSQQIVKCGQLLTQQTFALTAPGTAGQSIDYLIQVQYQDSDTDPENRPFFMASPATVNTIRRGLLSAAVKAGLPATTGTQVPPTPDSGFTGAWVITVANGQTQILSGDIAVYTGAPFLLEKLQDKISQSAADLRYPLSASFNNLVSSNGYQKFPGGLIIQWGTSSTLPNTGTPESTISQTFPIAFPTAVFSVTTGGIGASDGLGTAFVARYQSLTLSGVTLSGTAIAGSGFTASSAQISWVAIGH
jgi:hypothetical protein